MTTAIALPDDPARVIAAADDPDTAVIALLDRAKAWLLEANNIIDVRQGIAAAEAVRAYTVKAHLSRDAEQAACEMRVRFERRIGELLHEQREVGTVAKQGRPAKTSDTTKFSDMGLTGDESSQFQKLASIPEPEFEKRITTLRNEQKLSRAAMLAKKRAAEDDEHNQFVESLNIPDDYDPADDKRNQTVAAAAIGVVAAVRRFEQVAGDEWVERGVPYVRRLMPTTPAQITHAAAVVAAMAEPFKES